MITLKSAIELLPTSAVISNGSNAQIRRKLEFNRSKFPDGQGRVLVQMYLPDATDDWLASVAQKLGMSTNEVIVSILAGGVLETEGA